MLWLEYLCLALILILSSLAMADLVGLAAMATPGQATQPGTGPAVKRRKLRHYDLLPAQLLNSMGQSGVEAVALPSLWQTMCEGNKSAEAFSEWCFDESDRRGVALSRLSEVMVLAIGRLQDCQQLKDIIKAETYDKIKVEMDELLPHFQLLNVGAVPSEVGRSIRSIAYHRPLAAAGVVSDPMASAEAIHQWLRKGSSPLRSAIALFSAGGLFYVAQCHEKGARAFVASEQGSIENMRGAAARRQQRAPDNSQAELGGL